MLKTVRPVLTHTGEFRKTNKANKKYLAKDFNHRCAYCDDLDKIIGGYDIFHVEHFAPKEKFPELEFQYENLLYACPYCNRAKSDDWPSGDSRVNVVGNKGYINPCDEAYNKHLDRDEKTGEIVAISEVGKYMYEQLKLYLRRHSLIFKIEKLYTKRTELKDSIENDKICGKDVSKKEKILSLIDNEFFEYYTDLLAE